MSATPLSLAGLSVALAGPGRVGASLAGWLAARGAQLAILAARRDAADHAARLGFARGVDLAELASAGCGLLLVAVSDDALDAVAATLAARPQAAVALHTCGSRGASALAPLRRPPSEDTDDPGTAVGSLHPLRAFPVPAPDPAIARGMLLAIDGDPAAQALARRLAVAWDARAAEVPDEARVIYHYAATLAAGGVVTLLATAAELAHRAGLGADVAAGYVELARGAVAAVGSTADPAAAITGPVARGDGALVARQLAAVDATAPELAATCRHLALATLRALARYRPLTASQLALQASLEEELASGNP